MKPYIFSLSHRKIWLNDPHPEDVELDHIAAALSGINRFTGLGFSDTQHSVLVSRLVPEYYARWALLHDASEAYLGDVSGPLKALIGYEYKRLQSAWDECVARRFNIAICDVKPWDDLATMIEARDCGQLNPYLSGAVQLSEWFELPAQSYLCENMARRLAQFPPTVRESAEDARALFLARCAELGIE